MQTFPTHALLGVTVAQTLLSTTPSLNYSFSEWMFVLAIGLFAGITPDLVMVPMFFWDKYVRNIQPMTDQGPVTMCLKEVSHSIFIWPLSLVAFTLLLQEGSIRDYGIIYFICVILAGVVPDIFTHTDDKFIDTDPTFCFPFSIMFGMRLRLPFPSWDYRKEHGDLSMKNWEKRFDAVVLFCFFALLYVQYTI